MGLLTKILSTFLIGAGFRRRSHLRLVHDAGTPDEQIRTSGQHLKVADKTRTQSGRICTDQPPVTSASNGRRTKKAFRMINIGMSTPCPYPVHTLSSSNRTQSPIVSDSKDMTAFLSWAASHRLAGTVSATRAFALYSEWALVHDLEGLSRNAFLHLLAQRCRKRRLSIGPKGCKRKVTFYDLQL